MKEVHGLDMEHLVVFGEWTEKREVSTKGFLFSCQCRFTRLGMHGWPGIKGPSQNQLRCRDIELVEGQVESKKRAKCNEPCKEHSNTLTYFIVAAPRNRKYSPAKLKKAFLVGKAYTLAHS